MPFAKDIINQVAKTPKAAALQHCSMTCSACHVLQPELQRLQNYFINSKIGEWMDLALCQSCCILGHSTMSKSTAHRIVATSGVKQNRTPHLTHLTCATIPFRLQDAFFVHTRLRFLHHNNQTKSIFRNTFLWFVSKKLRLSPPKKSVSVSFNRPLSYLPSALTGMVMMVGRRCPTKPVPCRENEKENKKLKRKANGKKSSD